MSRERVDQVVRAVLYEGYILYPYRPSVKNRQRWTFGGLFPRAYGEARGGDPWEMQTECLLTGREDARLTITVRFLHLTERLVGELDSPLAEPPAGEEPTFRVVESLRVGERLVHTWQEAVEREVRMGEVRLGDLLGRAHREPFAFPGGRELEPLRDPSGPIVALLVRHREPVRGGIEAFAAPAGEGLFRLTVRVQNLSPLETACEMCRDEAQTRSFASTHAILCSEGGGFVSLTDPPEPYRDAAAGCRNVGAWPVLVGEEGDRDTVLSAPIILYDYPQVAPESPGDLFDSTEIDELLTLRILTLTGEEKRAMAAVDERARGLLERTEGLAAEEFRRLHGAVRELRPATPCHPEGRADG